MPVYSGNYSMKKFNKIKCFSYVFTVILALGFVLTACEKPAVTLTTPESVNGFKLNTFVQIDSYTSVSKNTLTEALNLCDYYENIFSRTKEDSELSKVNSNQTTSISKEMYEFKDKKDRSLALRPEGTAAVVRAYLEHKIFALEDVTKWYYHGSMFRYERPQTGRYREFNQIGVEVLGKKDPILDAEIISMAFEFLKKINIEDLEVQINSIGGKETRLKYREALINFLTPRKEKLCADCPAAQPIRHRGEHEPSTRRPMED